MESADSHPEGVVLRGLSQGLSALGRPDPPESNQKRRLFKRVRTTQQVEKRLYPLAIAPKPNDERRSDPHPSGGIPQETTNLFGRIRVMRTLESKDRLAADAVRRVVERVFEGRDGPRVPDSAESECAGIPHEGAFVTGERFREHPRGPVIVQAGECVGRLSSHPPVGVRDRGFERRSALRSPE